MTAMNSLTLEGHRVGRGQVQQHRMQLPPPEPWVEEALCPQIDADMFFPEKGGSTREAKRICNSCPVRAECLQHALDNDERFGIWGGLSERERRRLKRGELDAPEHPKMVRTNPNGHGAACLCSQCRSYKEPRPCRECGQEFRPVSPRAVYCHNACKQKAYREKSAAVVNQLGGDAA